MNFPIYFPNLHRINTGEIIQMRHSFLHTIRHTPVLGMVHVRALPGTPDSELTVPEICDIALTEAATLVRYGFDGIILENMHDRPYLKREVGPEIIAAMTIISRAVREKIHQPCGIQILAGANQAALAVAQAAGLDFIRAEGFVYSHVADEGFMNADAGPLLRYRTRIAASNIRIFTDIQKKHSAHAVTGDLDLVAHAKAAEFFSSDGLIITGSTTGEAPQIHEITRVKGATRLPVFLGSGITADNLADFWPVADGFIVGSDLKQDGLWSNDLDEERLKAFTQTVKELRHGSD